MTIKNDKKFKITAGKSSSKPDNDISSSSFLLERVRDCFQIDHS